jgi:hypothetical protein
MVPVVGADVTLDKMSKTDVFWGLLLIVGLPTFGFFACSGDGSGSQEPGYEECRLQGHYEQCEWVRE